MNVFDGIVYINLEKRKDRHKQMEAELKKCAVIPNKIFRIEGYDDELNGMRGCVYSHIKALDFALNQGWRNVLVLEDDCLFIKNQEKIHSYIHHFLNHFKNDWDLFFLGTQIHSFQKTDHENYVRVIFSLRAHAYVVNGHYILKLRNHFVSTYESLKDDLFL